MTDPKTESRLPLVLSLTNYVPRDERFGHLRMSDFLGQGLEAILKFLLPEFEALVDDTLNEFDSVEDILNLYHGGIKLPEGPLLEKLQQNVPTQMLKELLRSDGEGLFKYSTPQVIEGTIFTSPIVYTGKKLMFFWNLYRKILVIIDSNTSYDHVPIS